MGGTEAVGKFAGGSTNPLAPKANQGAEEMYGPKNADAADVVQAVQQSASVADDIFGRTIEELPYTTALAALALVG